MDLTLLDVETLCITLCIGNTVLHYVLQKLLNVCVSFMKNWPYIRRIILHRFT